MPTCNQQMGCTLNRHKNLEQTGFRGIPFFVCGRSMPSAQQRKTDLSIGIEIGIKPCSTLTCGFQIHEGWHIGVIRREKQIKNKAPVAIGCVHWPSNESPHLVDSIFVMPKDNRCVWVDWKHIFGLNIVTKCRGTECRLSSKNGSQMRHLWHSK